MHNFPHNFTSNTQHNLTYNLTYNTKHLRTASHSPHTTKLTAQP